MATIPMALAHCRRPGRSFSRADEAAAHWRKYLEYDRRGPWAEQARQRLKAIGEAPDDPDE